MNTRNNRGSCQFSNVIQWLLENPTNDGTEGVVSKKILHCVEGIIYTLIFFVLQTFASTNTSLVPFSQKFVYLH